MRVKPFMEISLVDLYSLLHFVLCAFKLVFEQCRSNERPKLNILYFALLSYQLTWSFFNYESIFKYFSFHPNFGILSCWGYICHFQRNPSMQFWLYRIDLKVPLFALFHCVCMHIMWAHWMGRISWGILCCGIDNSYVQTVTITEYRIIYSLCKHFSCLIYHSEMAVLLWSAFH